MGSNLFWWQFADLAFDIFHAAVLFFVSFAWIFPKLRKVHLIIVSCVVLSWVGLGFWFGIGYCFLTDWHWAIKEHLGEKDIPSSFISYFLQNLFGIYWSDFVVNVLSTVILIFAIFMSVLLNVRSFKRQKL